MAGAAALGRARPELLRPAAVTRLFAAVQEVFAEALTAGGTSFDSLYVNVNGQSGYFERSLAVYGRAGRAVPPVRDAGTARPVHEPVLVQLPEMPAAARGRSGDRRVTQARLTAWVAGRVQGVGFRWWARARALELGLAGWAENLEDGRVQVDRRGRDRGCKQLLALLEGPDTPGRVIRVTYRWDEPKGGMSGFAER